MNGTMLSGARAALPPLVFAAVMVAAILTGCSRHATGPSLSFAVESERLVPSSSLPNAASVCCCRVRGTVRNTSSIAVHLNLNFSGRDGRGASLGTALDFVPNVPPGGQASFDAAGIIAPCSQVASLGRQHFVTGVYTEAER